MPWAKFDEGLDENPKVEELLDADELTALAALGLWVLTITNCSRRLTDGRVTARTIRKLAPEQGERLTAVLLDAGLYEQAPNGVEIHDYLDYNPSAAEVAKRAAERSQAGKAGAAARWAKPPADDTSHSEAHSEPHTPSHASSHGEAHAATYGGSDAPTRTDTDTDTEPVPTRAGAREAHHLLSHDIDGERLPAYLAAFLQRGIDSIPEPGRVKTPTAAAIAEVLVEQPSQTTPAAVLQVAQDTRGTVQAQGKAPNVVALFASKLARAGEATPA